MIKTITLAAALAASAAGSTSLRADEPQMGGAMKHIFVTLNGSTVFVGLQGDPQERVWLYEYSESYAAPADVLNGKRFSSRYGWLAQGFWIPPDGADIFIEAVAQTPGLEVYEEGTFVPLFGTDGSSPRWKWSTMMVHNWYAAGTCGKYEATYRVYVGDSDTAEPVEGFTPAFVTLIWQFVPDTDPGDVDQDGDTDLADFAEFQQCLTGPGEAAMAPSCGCFDFDGDDDVDDVDLEMVTEGFTGPL